MTTSPQIDNADIVRSVYTAAAAGNTLRLLDVLAPDVEWRTAAGSLYPGRYIGPHAVLDGVFAKLGSEWSAFVAEPQTFVGHGDTVAVVGTYRGTYAATGKSMNARFTHIWELRDGMTVRFEQVVDSAVMRSVLP